MVKYIFVKLTTGDNIMSKYRQTIIMILISFFFAFNNLLLANILPSGGKDGSYWRPGSSQNISWDKSFLDTTKTLNIYLWNGDSSTLTLIGNNIISTTEHYIWHIPNNQVLGEHFKIKITYTDTTSNFYLISKDFFPISNEEIVLNSNIFTPNNSDSVTVIITPNPISAGNIINLSSENKFYHIDIYDISGILINSYNFNYTNNYNIDISDLSVGSYIVHIKFLRNVAHTQFIVE